MTKLILITGGVVSSVGKGVVTSSLGYLLRTFGVSATCIKIDPYLNIDAGTMSPFEHGEVFVLGDGSEVDLDLGNYERFLDLQLTGANSITSGKVFDLILKRERAGAFLGKTVQFVPHVTGAIKEAILDVNGASEVCLVELGGTPGDIESMMFIEALRQLKFDLGAESFVHIHVTYIPSLSISGEQKSKPAQQSILELRKSGLQPDVVICRSKDVLTEKLIGKISLYGMVPKSRVLSVPDLKSTFEVPLVIKKQNLVEIIARQLCLQKVDYNVPLKLVHSILDYEGKKKLYRKVNIAFIGKYLSDGSDCYISLINALKTSARFLKTDIEIVRIKSSDFDGSNPKDLAKSFDGVLIPGGFGCRGIEGKIKGALFARRNNVPFLGICLGMQIGVIEFARNELKMADANSTEFNPNTPHPVVKIMPEIDSQRMGGNMRVGAIKTLLSENSRLRDMYGGKKSVMERYRHRYEVDQRYAKAFEDKGLKFSALDEGENRLEAFEYPQNRFHVGVQFHPEFTNNPRRPSPVLFGFIAAAKEFCSAKSRGN